MSNFVLSAQETNQEANKTHKTICSNGEKYLPWLYCKNNFGKIILEDYRISGKNPFGLTWCFPNLIRVLFFLIIYDDALSKLSNT